MAQSVIKVKKGEMGGVEARNREQGQVHMRRTLGCGVMRLLMRSRVRDSRNKLVCIRVRQCACGSVIC